MGANGQALFRSPRVSCCNSQNRRGALANSVTAARQRAAAVFCGGSKMNHIPRLATCPDRRLPELCIAESLLHGKTQMGSVLDWHPAIPRAEAPGSCRPASAAPARLHRRQVEPPAQHLAPAAWGGTEVDHVPHAWSTERGAEGVSRFCRVPNQAVHWQAAAPGALGRRPPPGDPAPSNIWKASSICSSLKALRARQPSSLAFLHFGRRPGWGGAQRHWLQGPQARVFEVMIGSRCSPVVDIAFILGGPPHVDWLPLCAGKHACSGRGPVCVLPMNVFGIASTPFWLAPRACKVLAQCPPKSKKKAQSALSSRNCDGTGLRRSKSDQKKIRAAKKGRGGRRARRWHAMRWSASLSAMQAAWLSRLLPDLFAASQQTTGGLEPPVGMLPLPQHGPGMCAQLATWLASIAL